MPEQQKQTRSTIEHALRTHHAALVDAVHNVLNKAGVYGLTVHSIRFATAADFGECDPPCRPDERCVPQSDGGDVTWVCVPR